MYEFKREDAEAFARHVHIKAVEKRNQLHFVKCPYCGGTTNDKNTFAISLDTGQFKCLRESCGASGNMLTLAKDFDFSLGTDVDEYYKPHRQYKNFQTPEKPIVPKEPAIRYLNSRGISEEVAKRYEITTQTGKDNILVFPFYNEKGELKFIKYRKTDFRKGVDANKEWCEAQGMPILFGMKQCNMDNKTLIITEGQLDSLSVATAGIENAVSVPTGAKGFTWVPYCWDFIQQFDKIIVFGDYEKGHISLLDEIRQRFKKTICHVREEDYKDCKDANELLQRYGEAHIRTCIENAQQVKVNYLVDIADVKDINPFEVEKCSTGIKVLDRFLYGGFPFPSLVVLTGKRGEGKSTLGDQIVVEAVNQGYNSMIYSGELSAAQVKSGMVRQIAGPEHSFCYRTRAGYEGYNVSDNNKSQINEWLRGKLFLYDSTTIDEKVGLTAAIETAIKQYGVRVILLDNLMTAMSLEDMSEDKYEAQGKLTQKLAHMAMEYNVIIILVAHKRKNTTYDEQDDISGSSEITNLASVTISYSRSREIDEDQRLLKLLKNRMFGRLETNGWIMNYDEKSCRIYGDGDDVEKDYGCIKSEWTNEVPDNLPF